jgi:hypothetical protein
MGQSVGKYVSCCKNPDNLNYDINNYVTSIFKMNLYKDILEILTEGIDILVIKIIKFYKYKFVIFNELNENIPFLDKLLKKFVNTKHQFQYIDFLIFLYPVTNHLENKEEDLIRLIKNHVISNNEKVSYNEIDKFSYFELKKFFYLYIFYQTKFMLESLESLLSVSKEYLYYQEMYSEIKINDYVDYLCYIIQEYSASKKEVDLVNVRIDILTKWIKKNLYICEDIALRIDYERFSKENIISV